ncbi:cationic amino acid transporter 3, mitochondrial-like isoform X1 [Carex rostrata]
MIILFFVFADEINEEKRRKLAAMNIAFVVVGVLILTASASATFLSSSFPKYFGCVAGGLLLLTGLGVLSYIDQDDGRHSFGHTGAERWNEFNMDWLMPTDKSNSDDFASGRGRHPSSRVVLICTGRRRQR